MHSTFQVTRLLELLSLAVSKSFLINAHSRSVFLPLALGGQQAPLSPAHIVEHRHGVSLLTDSLSLSRARSLALFSVLIPAPSQLRRVASELGLCNRLHVHLVYDWG